VQVLRQADLALSDTARLAIPDVCAAALAVSGVLGCHSIRTRGTAADVLVDLHIQVDPASTVAEGHRIAEEVERPSARASPRSPDVLRAPRAVRRVPGAQDGGRNESHGAVTARRRGPGAREPRPTSRPQRDDLLLELAHDLLERLLRQQVRELLAVVADRVDFVDDVVHDDPAVAAARQVVFERDLLFVEKAKLRTTALSPVIFSPSYSKRPARARPSFLIEETRNSRVKVSLNVEHWAAVSFGHRESIVPRLPAPRSR